MTSGIYLRRVTGAGKNWQTSCPITLFPWNKVIGQELWVEELMG